MDKLRNIVVGRIDKYEDRVTSVIDENIEQIARLSAFKQKLQNDIFEKSKEYQLLLSDITSENKINSHLITQVSFAQ